MDVKIGISCQVYERCRAYRGATEVVETDVVESTDVRFVWRDVLNLLERERFIMVRVESGGDVRGR